MSSGIIYFTFGKSHLARLLVSLVSLRKVYDGPVAVINGGGDDGIVGAIAYHCGVHEVPMKVKMLRKNTAYVAKSSLYKHCPYRWVMYLDSDTVVAKDPSRVFAFSAFDRNELIVTRFSDWRTTGPIYSSRIRQWLNVRSDCRDIPALAMNCLRNSVPAINTGVVAFRVDNPILPAWEEVTQAGTECRFTDELALQILLPTIPHLLLDDMWNASPIYRRARPEDVIIWHFHGTKNLRRSAGWEIWWPIFDAVREANVAGIQDWMRVDKSLAHL